MLQRELRLRASGARGAGLHVLQAAAQSPARRHGPRLPGVAGAGRPWRGGPRRGRRRPGRAAAGVRRGGAPEALRPGGRGGRQARPQRRPEPRLHGGACRAPRQVHEAPGGAPQRGPRGRAPAARGARPGRGPPRGLPPRGLPLRRPPAGAAPLRGPRLRAPRGLPLPGRPRPRLRAHAPSGRDAEHRCVRGAPDPWDLQARAAHPVPGGAAGSAAARALSGHARAEARRLQGRQHLDRSLGRAQAC
mmetsp:Transcript_52153/g.167062  ORF Transcript_52153/g.167062 Transcript_52153/m.167062 type:complete len:247 (-) Transcript_52153:422-1162(-)